MTFRRGFTIVELVVVMTIMTILLVLGVVGLSTSQSYARDAERKTDAENIARAIERFRDAGNIDRRTNPSSPITYPAGSYPTYNQASTATFLSHTLPELDDDSRSYSFSNVSPHFALAGPTSGVHTIDGTDNLAAINSAYSALGTSGADVLIYQPIAWSTATNSWITCRDGDECRRFNLYYLNENDDGAGKLKKIMSKSQ